MKNRKTIEQLRAEKAQAEARLEQEKHKLTRLESRKSIWKRANGQSAPTASVI